MILEFSSTRDHALFGLCDNSLVIIDERNAMYYYPLDGVLFGVAKIQLT